MALERRHGRLVTPLGEYLGVHDWSPVFQMVVVGWRRWKKGAIFKGRGDGQRGEDRTFDSLISGEGAPRHHLFICLTAPIRFDESDMTSVFRK